VEILFVTREIYPHFIGGAEIFNYYLIKELKKYNFAVKYLSLHDAQIKGIQFVKINMLKPSRIFIPFQTIIKLLVNRKKIDLIHLSYTRSSLVHWFFYPIIKKLFNLRYSITIHDPRGWGHKTIFKWIFNEAEFIVGVSEKLCEEYKKRCNNKFFHYIPPLIPFQKAEKTKAELRKALGLPPDKIIFLFAGSLKDIKRPLTVLGAVSHIGEDFCKKNNLLFLFAGQGNLRPQIDGIIENSFLKNFVLMLGMLSQKDLNSCYKLSDCYIISSIYEGRSISLSQAMFNGLAVIGSNAPGINDILCDNKNSLLFEIDNQYELASKIERLVADNDLRAELSRNAADYYQSEFRHDKMITGYVNLFRSII